MFPLFYRRVYRNVAEMRWGALCLIALAHFASSWGLMAMAEADEIVGADAFWYYYLVTATTVGYGDLAPREIFGRLIAVLWIMPGGIALFTTAIAKGAQAMAESWRRNMRGSGDFSKLDGHIIVIGWRGEQSEKLLEQLSDETGGGAPGIVIISDGVAQNPAPDRAHFIKAESLSDLSAYERGGLALATSAIVMAQSDADSLAGALAAASVAPNLRLVVYFEDERMATLLKAHCPMAETAPSLSIELLARAARDAGSAELLFTLASSKHGPTEFSLVVPDAATPMLYGHLLIALKRDMNATLLGVKAAGSARSMLNPAWAHEIVAGDRIYYVADQRLDPRAIKWATVGEGAVN